MVADHEESRCKLCLYKKRSTRHSSSFITLSAEKAQVCIFSQSQDLRAPRKLTSPPKTKPRGTGGGPWENRQSLQSQPEDLEYSTCCRQIDAQSGVADRRDSRLAALNAHRMVARKVSALDTSHDSRKQARKPANQEMGLRPGKPCRASRGPAINR